MLAKRDFDSAAIIGVVFLLIGIACGVGATLFFRSSLRKVMHWKRGNGTVVDYVVYTPTSYNKGYTPKIQFTSDDGKEVIFVASTGSNIQRYRIGDIVKLRYSADNPDKADLDSFTNLWLGPIFLTLLALPFSGAGLFLIFKLIGLI
jgi:hypothetical protein